jgi:gag-polypeptide of LTR copia-type
MTDVSPMFNFNPNPNQSSTRLRTNSDFNSSQKLTNVPQNGRNFIPWANAARVTLKDKKILDFINENKIRPETGAEEQEEWDMVDSQAMRLITNSLEPQLSESFCYCETAAELWQEIKNQHSNQKSHSQIYHLKQEITKISQESRDVPTLIRHVRAKYKELKFYRPNTTDLRVLQEREEMDHIYILLAA